MKRENLKEANEINSKITYLEERINHLDKMIKTENPLYISGNYENIIINRKNNKEHIYEYLKNEALKEKKYWEEEFNKL